MKALVHLVVSPPPRESFYPFVASILVDEREWLTQARLLAAMLASGSAIAAYAYRARPGDPEFSWFGLVPSRRALRFASAEAPR